MRIALVLGAGATLADARARGGSGAGELPPLDTTFFTRIAELGLKVPRGLREYAVELLDSDPFSAVESSPRMEEFFKDLFYDFQQERAVNGQFARAYGQLLTLYAATIRSTTNWLCEAPGIGPVPKLLAAAVESADHVDVLTLNHDLVVENVLAGIPGLLGAGACATGTDTSARRGTSR